MRVVLIVLAGGLAVAMLAQFASLSSRVAQMPSHFDTLPTSGNGWTSKALSPGQTEAQSASVATVLKYDDMFYREFSSAGGTFAVYAAFWAPGKMPTQLVASHTPDRCWTSAGWSCGAQQHGSRLRIEGVELGPAEERIFTSGDRQVQYVMYWHLVGGQPYDYGERFNAVPSFWRWWRDAARQVFSSPPEQYFIRVSSDRRLQELTEDLAFKQVLAQLGKLGLVTSH